MHDAPDLINDHEDDISPAYVPYEDPVSAGVGSQAYLTPHTISECVERFDGGVARFPERFDRFYFDAPGGPLLVDILADGTPEQLELERARKRVAFKTRWCAEHDRRYLPLGESDIAPEKIRMLLARKPGEHPRVSQPAPAKPTGRRGTIQRPKAATGL